MPKSNYPQLTAMGILNPLQIDRYQVNSISNYDVLRVIYQRGEGSFLPSSRTYRFPRVQKSLGGGKEKKPPQAVMETHPDLRKATSELEILLKTKAHKECVAETVIEELASLEEEIFMRSEYIKELVKRL